MRALALLALAACGDNRAVAPDAATPDASLACSARYTGNFAEDARGDACATVTRGDDGHLTLALAIPTVTLAPAVDATIDLGLAPSAGAYGPASVVAWSARGVRLVGDGACVYNGGTAAVPTGAFALELEDFDGPARRAHGTLALELAVLAYPSTDCGAGDTEHVTARF